MHAELSEYEVDINYDVPCDLGRLSGLAPSMAQAIGGPTGCIPSFSFNLGVPRPPLCAEHECRAVTMPKNDAECRMIYAECRAMTCDRCRCRADDHGTGKNH